MEKSFVVLRAMGFFRLPASIKDIARTISRTAWGSVIKEDDVEDVISTRIVFEILCQSR